MSVWKGKDESIGSSNSKIPSLLYMNQRITIERAQQDVWNNFWGGYVEMVGGAGHCMPRYVWVNEFILELNDRIGRQGYTFAFSRMKMCRKMMYWLYELTTAAAENRPAGLPQPHTRHRNKLDDFTEFDYRMGFSDRWLGLINHWKTTDMEETYENDLAAFIGDFVYCNIDTERSPTIVESDRAEAEYLRDIDNAEDEAAGRRIDDKRRVDPYYQDAGYFKGNREYM